MSKVISSEKLSETLTISEFKDGWWLYDKTRGMNLGMREESREKALLSAIKYYQDRLLTVEDEHADLRSRVDSFVEQFTDDTE